MQKDAFIRVLLKELRKGGVHPVEDHDISSLIDQDNNKGAKVANWENMSAMGHKWPSVAMEMLFSTETSRRRQK
jgi:hypothetical protein